MSPRFNRASTRRWRRRFGRSIAAAGVAFLWVTVCRADTATNDDLLQKAINYVFTGTVEPENAPEITDRESCAVVVLDPKWKRYIRYNLSRLRLDDPRIDATYSGRKANYQLDAESDQFIVEYLSADRKTVTNSYKSAQIPLPGDIDRTRKAMQLIARLCKPGDATKLPF